QSSRVRRERRPPRDPVLENLFRTPAQKRLVRRPSPHYAQRLYVKTRPSRLRNPRELLGECARDDAKPIPPGPGRTRVDLGRQARRACANPDLLTFAEKTTEDFAEVKRPAEECRVSRLIKECPRARIRIRGCFHWGHEQQRAAQQQ